jgi:hypothetical protein
VARVIAKKMSDELMKPNTADSRQRQILDCLRSGDWKIRDRLPVPVGDRMLERLLDFCWIEKRGDEASTEIRITEDGMIALKSPS